VSNLLLVHLPDVSLDGSKPVFTPPLGLWSMRSNNYGQNISVIDLSVEGLPIVPLPTEAVGYSLLFPSHIGHLEWARLHFPSSMEYLGGPTGSRLSIPGMTNVVGPGEDWLAGRHVHFDDLNPLYFHHHAMEPYWKRGRPFSALESRKRWMPVETSRGCPNACGFCAIPALWKRWEPRSLSHLDDYFSYLQSAHKIEEILFIDDNISLDIQRFLGIIDLMKKYDFTWSCVNGIYLRALLQPNVLPALEDSGCRYLSLPFEAGNVHSANLMNLGKKYVTFEEAAHLTEQLKTMGIHTAGQFIIGYPGETEDNVQATLSYANGLPLSERHIHLAMPLPGTAMMKKCEEWGWLDDAPAAATYKTPVISTPLLSRETLYKIWKADREAAMRRKETI
jgi:radical SAM superfamily enzyme YgiQ (UPF0313 family)